MGDARTMVALDLEGVLVPEIWVAVAVAVAEHTGIDRLRCTTRNEADYDVLMRYRLDVVAEHRLAMPAMLAEADAGFLFRAPQNVIAQFARFPALATYEELLAAMTGGPDGYR